MILFVDMDEVLADTCGAHVARYNSDFNDHLTLAMCEGAEVWQNVAVERQASVRQHAMLRGFFRSLEPIAKVFLKNSPKSTRCTSLRPLCNFQIHWKKKVNGSMSIFLLFTGKIASFVVTNIY